jgi:hypothetical protein
MGESTLGSVSTTRILFQKLEMEMDG